VQRHAARGYAGNLLIKRPIRELPTAAAVADCPLLQQSRIAGTAVHAASKKAIAVMSLFPF